MKTERITTRLFGGTKSSTINFLLQLIVVLALFSLSSCAQKTKKKEKDESYFELQLSWNELAVQYTRRDDLIKTLVHTGENFSIPNKEVFTKVTTTREEIQGASYNLDSLTKERFERYENLQTKISKQIPELIDLLKSNTNTARIANECSAMLPKLEGNIDKARNKFVPLFKSYNKN